MASVGPADASSTGAYGFGRASGVVHMHNGLLLAGLELLALFFMAPSCLVRFYLYDTHSSTGACCAEFCFRGFFALFFAHSFL